jgi:hypothetical protein
MKVAGARATDLSSDPAAEGTTRSRRAGGGVEMFEA